MHTSSFPENTSLDLFGYALSELEKEKAIVTSRSFFEKLIGSHRLELPERTLTAFIKALIVKSQ